MCVCLCVSVCVAVAVAVAVCVLQSRAGGHPGAIQQRGQRIGRFHGGLRTRWPDWE